MVASLALAWDEVRWHMMRVVGPERSGVIIGALIGALTRR